MAAVAPILPSRDLEITSQFYERLGFDRAGLWPGEYLIMTRWEIGLHFFHSPSLDPWSSDAGCYLYVDDAGALHAEYEGLDLPARASRDSTGPRRKPITACASSPWSISMGTCCGSAHG